MSSTQNSKKLFDHRKMYRFPWNLPDNVAAWLEVTTTCNMYCEGCYRENTNQHRTLAEIAEELDILEASRTFDGLSIAGGEPLLHPDITEIVRMIARKGWKPAILTNGVLLTEDLIKALRDAGLYKFTIHVDSKQNRAGWKGKTEVELNEIRLRLAEMVANVGGISCNFNMTIYRDTLETIPEIVRWMIKHVDVAHGMTFLCYRTPDYKNFNYWVEGKQVNFDETVYADYANQERIDITSEDIAAKIMEVLPDYSPSAYLNGTARPDSLKWAICGRIGTSEKTYGYIGPKTVEFAQAVMHLLTGRYLSFRKPPKFGIWSWASWLWIFDKELRKALLNYFLDIKAFFPKLHLQTLDLHQPIDLLPDGRQDMCDGCPDMMVWNGRLVWSCRLDECLKFGNMAYTTPK
jgi:pyruvate-formate lyase-activating enzyme